MSSTTVSFGDLTATNAPAPSVDGAGCVWILQKLDGWWGGLGPRGNPIARPMTDGTYDGPATMDGRTVTVSGIVQAPSEGALYDAMDDLAGVLSGTSRVGPLVVQEDSRGVARRSLVRLGGATLVDRIANLAAAFSFSLYAPDPLRYSAAVHSAVTTRFTPGLGWSFPLTFPMTYGPSGTTGALTVSNTGNVTTWPVFQFTGPLVNPSIRLVGGPAITALITLNAGEVLTIDTSDRSVFLGPSTRRQFLSADTAWFGLPPGSSGLYFAADSGAGTVTVQWRDAWT